MHYLAGSVPHAIILVKLQGCLISFPSFQFDNTAQFLAGDTSSGLL